MHLHTPRAWKWTAPGEASAGVCKGWIPAGTVSSHPRRSGEESCPPYRLTKHQPQGLKHQAEVSKLTVSGQSPTAFLASVYFQQTSPAVRQGRCVTSAVAVHRETPHSMTGPSLLAFISAVPSAYTTTHCHTSRAKRASMDPSFLLLLPSQFQSSPVPHSPWHLYTCLLSYYYSFLFSIRFLTGSSSSPATSDSFLQECLSN